MAAAGDIQALCEEATCPVCLDYFRDPVTIAECGHNFCQACLAQSWGEEEDVLVVSCPQCREATQRKSLIPNRALKNMVGIAQKLSLGEQRRARAEERVCEKHQEPLKLFCRDHDAPMCVVCDRSKEHESHEVVPLEEAFQEYQDQISSRLKILRAEREKILTYKADAEKESQDLLNQTEEERQKTMAEFRQIHQFLEEQEKNLLVQIEEVEKEIARRRDEHLDILSRELSSLENLIQDMEEKCQLQASEFLQDVNRTLQRYEKKKAFENPVAFPPEVTCKIRKFADRKPLLEGVMKQFQAVDAPLKPLPSYKAGASQLTPDAGAPDGQQPATDPCLGTCFSFTGSMTQPAFGNSSTQAPFGGSSPLVPFGAKSITTQPVFGVPTPTFSFGTATTSAASGFGVTTQMTSSSAGSAVIQHSAPFQFTIGMPSQPAAAGSTFGLSSAGSGNARDPAVGTTGAALALGSSLSKPTLSSQNQGLSFTFSKTPEGKLVFRGSTTPFCSGAETEMGSLKLATRHSARRK